jgi:hypothetical protein
MLQQNGAPESYTAACAKTESGVMPSKGQLGGSVPRGSFGGTGGSSSNL